LGSPHVFILLTRYFLFYNASTRRRSPPEGRTGTESGIITGGGEHEQKILARLLRFAGRGFHRMGGDGRPGLMDLPNREKCDDDVTSDLCRRFGSIAVKKGFVTIEELNAAVMEQIDDDARGCEHRLLGSILYDRGMITEHQIEAVLLELKKTL